MASKRHFRRRRRRQAVAYGGIISGGLGVLTLFSAGKSVVHHEAGGLPRLAIGAGFLLAGVIAAAWALKSADRAEAADQLDLERLGLDDSLPYGAFRDGDRIGLDAADSWLVLAVPLAVFGGVMLVSAATDPWVGWSGVAIAAVLFAITALAIWLGSGTPYWLEPHRLTCRGPFRRSIEWSQIERFRLASHGSGVDRADLADEIELQAKPDEPESLRRQGVTVRMRLVELDAPDLLRLLQERCPAAHQIGHPKR